jgi:hypothetical protein
VGIAAWIRGRFASPKRLGEWFVVSHDDAGVHMSVSPPGRQPWQDSFAWSSVQRVCFKCEGLEASDGIYVFTSQRPESYVIPTEAGGGSEIWSEILRRGLFDPELAIRATASVEGLFCWPSQ